MAEVNIRVEGAVGRITINRPDALNAISYDMCMEIEKALDMWRDDNSVEMLLIDAAGPRAFSAGGDISVIYDAAKNGKMDYVQTYWRDEYQMNAKLYEYPKPTVSFMQGFTMGGGVGVGCHCSHRIVGESSKIAMPECGIGLVPDVGGSMLLANAPGHCGEYMGTTGTRMGPSDAIFAGFADHYVPEDDWPALMAVLLETADPVHAENASVTPPKGNLPDNRDEIDQHFGGKSLQEILASLEGSQTEFATNARKLLLRSAPLSMACTLEIIQELRGTDDIRKALELEYRFTYRSMQDGDFIEGIRAAIIDKDRNPNWQHSIHDDIADAVKNMLAPLGPDTLTFEER